VIDERAGKGQNTSVRARKPSSLGALGALLFLCQLCHCATAGTGDDSAQSDSGNQQAQDSGGAADSTIGSGDSGPGPGFDSGAPATDTGTHPADTGTTTTDSSTAADSGTTAADSGQALTDSGVAADTAVVDTGTQDTSTTGGSCQPGSVAGFTAANVTSLNDNQACTGPQINSLVTDCFDPAATQAGCTTWQNNNAGCFNSCTLFSPYAATNVTPGMSPPPAPMGPWGPFISVLNPGEIDFLNLGACVSLADPTQTACGNALTAAFECEYDVCASSCSIPVAPADPTAAQTAYDNCSAAADGCPATGNGPCTGVCGSYANTINTACGNTALNGAASFCLDGSLSSTSGATADPSLEKLIKQQCVN
jgi:hypothetical protein